MMYLLLLSTKPTFVHQFTFAYLYKIEKHRIDVEKVHNTEARRKQRDARNRSNEALLHRAARVGDMKNVMKALDNGADVNCTGSNHDTGVTSYFSLLCNCYHFVSILLFLFNIAPLTLAFILVLSINALSASCGLYQWGSRCSEISA